LGRLQRWLAGIVEPHGSRRADTQGLGDAPPTEPLAPEPVNEVITSLTGSAGWASVITPVAGFAGLESVVTPLAGFARSAPPTTGRPHRHSGGFQIGRRSLSADTGFTLNPPQRPPQPPQCYDLLFLLLAQDIAHVDEGYTLRQGQRPECGSRWPIFR
jgi:hypothetical protein